ncbi:MAG: hypothetical protein E7376_02250 [Clostridiales bacterium]|nr:hypothetical protein [Clostridiales bacterium]
MDRNNVKLKDITWIIGYRVENGKKKLVSATPYVISNDTIKGYQMLVDLTSEWATDYKGRVTKENIIASYVVHYNAQVGEMLDSKTALVKYVLTHNNAFSREMKYVNDITEWYENKILNKKTGTDLIHQINVGVIKADKERIKSAGK